MQLRTQTDSKVIPLQNSSVLTISNVIFCCGLPNNALWHTIGCKNNSEEYNDRWQHFLELVFLVQSFASSLCSCGVSWLALSLDVCVVSVYMDDIRPHLL